ncbi:hypothetical protein GCM10009647_076600 [Streptomyces sanglieri]
MPRPVPACSPPRLAPGSSRSLTPPQRIRPTTVPSPGRTLTRLRKHPHHDHRPPARRLPGPFRSRSAPARPGNNEEADRSENAVLTAYFFHLTAKGHRVLRHRVVTDPALASTDLFDETARELVMACHRSHYRALITAYGVISDCERLFSPARRALLFTTEPGPVAREFLSHHKLIAIWPEGETFVRADPAAETGGA